jgi:hypothetical protein
VINNEFKDILGLEEINTPEQLDSFEVQYLQGMNPRWIFDLSAGVYPVITPILWPYDTDTNQTLDQGETEFDSDSSGYLYIYGTKNTVYWQGPPRWLGPGQPGDANLFYRNHRVLRNSYSDPNIGFPSLSYADTPATKFFEEYMVDGDLNSPPGVSQEALRMNSSAKASFLHQVPVINKNIAMRINKTIDQAFRSGYFEFSLKTDNQNCMIFNSSNGSVKPDTTTTIDKDTVILNKSKQNTCFMSVEIKNGKLLFKYDDLTVDNPQSFEILSNQIIADNEWHHIVINFNKNGILTLNRKKLNKRTLEFWIDGKLDIINYEVLNKKQIFIPAAEWFFIDPRKSATSANKDAAWTSYDTESSYNRDIGGVGTWLQDLGTSAVGEQDFYLRFTNGIWNSAGDDVAFSGLFYIFIGGINNALSPKDIQLRYSLFIDDKPRTADPITANAEMINPNISTNKKKALKLFWNNVSFNNGVELDNKYQVETLCVTHKNKISKTETYNIDLANSKEIKYLSDVKALFTDNINIFGPGKFYILSNSRLQKNPRGTGFDGITKMLASSSYETLESVTFIDYDPIGAYKLNKKYDEYPFTDGAIVDIPFSNISLVDGDRILLTNQIRPKENGIYIFNGLNNPLTRAEDANSPAKINNGVIRVVDGIYKDTSWILENTISSISDAQVWVQLESHPTAENINAQPIFTSRWSNQNGTQRLINLEEDIDITKYDLIVFMNYPETHKEIEDSFDNLTDLETKDLYKNFIKSLQNVTSNGASLYVSSPKLAQDLGIVKQFTYIDQVLESSDAQAAILSPFEVGEPADKYFDTHRNNRYELATPIAGLTNKPTYILTDFINYNPDNNYDYEQYHAKYAYRQFGLQEGNEFIIPGLSLRKVTINENLPGFVQNQKKTAPLAVVAPSDILAGTVVTKLANTYYNGSTVVNNPYDDYASTIIVRNGQLLAGQPTNGKIFVNCVEDAYTFSREEYNKAIIQVVPSGDTNESVATRAWQYSTTRLDREPEQINIKELTEYGQTTPTNGGGGAFIQAPSNSSNGIIRSQNDFGNKDYQSDLYPSQSEERYPIQEIPVLSMTYLGLLWLAE